MQVKDLEQDGMFHHKKKTTHVLRSYVNGHLTSNAIRAVYGGESSNNNLSGLPFSVSPQA